VLGVHSTDGPVPVTAAAQKGPSSSCHPRSGNTESVAEHKTYAVTELSALQEKLAIYTLPQPILNIKYRYGLELNGFKRH